MRTRIKRLLPAWQNILLAVLAAVLLILAFPDFEFSFLGWVALVPLMRAVERERASTLRSFVLGWIFGTLFFFGTCWWLTYAPITYAGFPWPLAYFLLFCVTAVTGLFPAMFAGVLAVLLRRFGAWAFLAAPFVWVTTEFLRYWLTGNNWNAVGYSQAFRPLPVLGFASLGGVALVGFLIAFANSAITAGIDKVKPALVLVAAVIMFVSIMALWPPPVDGDGEWVYTGLSERARVVAIQPNVPMSGLDSQKWHELRERQIGLAEAEIKKLRELPTASSQLPTLVILPESPMNFMYEDDREFQAFINDFARRNNVSVLFNSAEPDKTTGKYFNSAVMVGPDGSQAAQYDKIYLLPFGEAVPAFLEGIVPGFVGNFSYGREYDLLPVGDTRAGVMICFESHFGQLSREYVRNGADVLIEMTNDGYLGPTPVLRQHLANAVFRAVETRRSVLRVTNVGITAEIIGGGYVIGSPASYTEATQVWSVSRSDGGQTFYVRYGDWFSWLSTVVTLGLLIICIRRRRAETRV